MVTKRESPGAKTMSSKTASAKISSAKIAKRTATAATSIIDPEVRRQMVAAEAYFRAERRGFAAGQEVEDWIAAESVVDSRSN